MQQKLHWHLKHYKALTTDELYEMLQLRSKVFVVEQNCVYLDVDDKDKHAFHFWGANESGKIIGYVRLLPPGLSYEEASIGRVLTHPEYRRNGFGIELMQRAIETTLEQFNVNSIRISAQCYLENFYANLGFAVVGEPYLEDDIPHVEMLLQRTN